MKKILIFEYITGGGLIEKKVDNSLLFEAEIILNSLIETCNYEVNFFCVLIFQLIKKIRIIIKSGITINK